MHGRVALVTGAASGIGRACAARYAAAGATVIVTDVLDGDGRAAAVEVGGSYRHLDVSDPSACGFPNITDRLGCQTLVVCHADNQVHGVWNIQ